MALSKFTKNVNNNQSQPDQPTLSSEEMKKLLDQAGIDIKEYINEILTEELDQLIESKVDKIKGKGLSEKDFTSTYETKLKGIANGAQVNSVTGVKGNSENSYRTGNINITPNNIGLGNVENKSSETIRKEITKANITSALGYTPPTTNTTYGVASTSSNGLMSATDKKKLDNIANGATKNVVSNSLNDISTINCLSAYQGKILNDKINNLINKLNEKAEVFHSNTSSKYGLGNSSSYGHVKLINNCTTSNYNSGEALSAKQGYILMQEINKLKDIIKTLRG